MNRRIKGFHQDNFGIWVAQLACGHHQRLRHAPPLLNRMWVTTAAGRAAALGAQLNCRKCSEEARLAGEEQAQPAYQG
jgi:hypothetical protein